LLFLRFIIFFKHYKFNEFWEKLISLPEIYVLMLVKIVTSYMLSPLCSQITMWILEAHGKVICLNLKFSKTEVVKRIRLSSELGWIASQLQGIKRANGKPHKSYTFLTLKYTKMYRQTAI